VTLGTRIWISQRYFRRSGSLPVFKPGIVYSTKSPVVFLRTIGAYWIPTLGEPHHPLPTTYFLSMESLTKPCLSSLTGARLTNFNSLSSVKLHGFSLHSPRLVTSILHIIPLLFALAAMYIYERLRDSPQRHDCYTGLSQPLATAAGHDTESSSGSPSLCWIRRTNASTRCYSQDRDPGGCCSQAAVPNHCGPGNKGSEQLFAPLRKNEESTGAQGTAKGQYGSSGGHVTARAPLCRVPGREHGDEAARRRGRIGSDGMVDTRQDASTPVRELYLEHLETRGAKLPDRDVRQVNERLYGSRDGSQSIITLPSRRKTETDDREHIKQ